MEIIDKCIFTKCPLKENCYRFGEELRQGQLTIFNYNNGCVHFWDTKHTPVKQYSMEVIIKGKSVEEIFKLLKLKKHSLYKCKVKCSENNVKHTAFLFVGFKTGSYCQVYTNNYDCPIDMTRCYSISNVKFLSKIK
jgi:hypothetical protein